AVGLDVQGLTLGDDRRELGTEHEKDRGIVDPDECRDADTERAIQAAVRAEHPDERREDPRRAFPRETDDERRDPRRTRRDLHVRPGAIEKAEPPDGQTVYDG